MAKEDVERLKRELDEKENDLKVKVLLVGDQQRQIETLQEALKNLQGRYDVVVVENNAKLGTIADLEEKLRAMDEALFERAKGGIGRIEIAEEASPPSEEDLALIGEACERYGIDEKYILNARVDRTGREPVAIVVTAGGAKVRFSLGMNQKIVPLDAVRVDGIVRKKMKVVAGAKK